MIYDSGFPWENNEVVNSVYNEKENYKVVDTDSGSNKAIIFFTGNGLYYPNTEQTFIDSVITRDHYEWMSVAQAKQIKNAYSRIIFLRDVYKQWYVRGINKDINSIDKLMEYLKDLTAGYDVTTCGTSAGGYLALIGGGYLKAEKIFSFSSQFTLEDRYLGQPYLREDAEIMEKRKFYDLIASPCISIDWDKVYHFYPVKCDEDQEQYTYAYKSLKHTFAFDKSVHGDTVQGICYPTLFTMPRNSLDELSEKYRDNVIDAVDFTKHIVPIHERIPYQMAKKVEMLVNRVKRVRKSILHMN